ncbi:MAG: 3-isopropylmalate dehydratase [Candidatus Abyssobacteria bacterium SURF_5]|uniref:3-isopropylmalate dehydratase small subunit n=1 Tax=Abyssobacteria bacterium (strain SURF_5) TaxID=2093360 RepID=A0A3A4NU48_ABYX5|nr:MAG: 3-isopropylmalate dehydratase [Candidatus Abyssubacteria bacterium SURF_5]
MERLKIRGKTWTFGDNVDTDQITPSQYMDLPVEEMSRHVLEPVDPDFAKKFQPGEIIVGGSNFGCGSSRETAPEALKYIGVAAVVAENFGRIFFRNSIAIGLPVLVCPHVSREITQGDEIEIDLDAAQVTILKNKKTLPGLPLNAMMLTSLKKGGIMKLLVEI